MRLRVPLWLVGLSLAGQVLAQTAQVQAPGVGSSVTLFGVADADISYGTGSMASKTQMQSGGNTSSRVGFRGLEDLGGGLGAGFWLEAGVNVDDGTGGSTNINNQPDGSTSGGGLAFNRRATVSLMGSNWGELRLGRDFTATYRNRDQTDPFATNGVGASQPYVGSIAGPTATRASNMLGYFLPADLGGFFGEVQYFMGENVSPSPISQNGDGYAARVGWGKGPFAIAVATGTTRFARTLDNGDIQVVNLGASYDFNVVKVTAGYFHDRVDQLFPVNGTGYIVGAIVPVANFDQLKFAYSSYGTNGLGDPRADKFAVGYVYNFSKRTAVYATYAYLSNKGGSNYALNGSLTAPNHSSQGYDLGLKHSF